MQKVAAICPGFVATDMTAGMKKSTIGIQAENDELPPDEMIQVEDIARMVNYLLNLSKATWVPDIIIQCTTALE